MGLVGDRVEFFIETVKLKNKTVKLKMLLYQSLNYTAMEKRRKDVKICDFNN